MKTSVYGVAAAFLIFLLNLPVVIFATSRIVKPINALMVENKKVRERNFEDVKEVQTNIIELSRLSSSLVDMSKSIQAYQEAQKELMDSFIRLIADAIDAKSPPLYRRTL